MPTVCLKNTSTKHNKYVVNQKLDHVGDISFREFLVESAVFFFVFFFLQNKICPFLAQGICMSRSDAKKNKVVVFIIEY
jgi:hypothetical protein